MIELLGISDVFLYTSRRGTNFSMAVLEAMAAGCAVIATTEPVSNRELLAEGRGYAIPSEDAEAVAGALAAAVADPGREAMGRLARRHVAERHGAEELRRTLLRACFWSADLGPRRPPA